MKSSKIKTVKNISFIFKKEKAQGKKTVAVSGSFDILHSGHVSMLEEAKKQGDLLVVLLNSDSSVRSYKGPNRPIISQEDRAVMLSALSVVDYVAIFDEINPKAALEIIKPDVFCNGSDWGKDCIERETVEKNGGAVKILSFKVGISTTDLMSKIVDANSRPTKGVVFLDRDGTINDNKEGYVHAWKDFTFLPGVIDALVLLKKNEYNIIILTNQSGIGRGYFSEKSMHNLHGKMKRELKARGITIDSIYHCPHLPGDGCFCRKPKPGLFLQAAKDFGFSLAKSWFIGDDERDIIAGREVNVKTIKIGEKLSRKSRISPNYYAKNLLEAVKIIVGENK